MARLIARLASGITTQAATQRIQGMANVTDAVPARSVNAVTVVVPDDRASEMRQQLAQLEFVSDVFDDIQAVPQVADQEALDDFFRKVRENRATEEPPSTIETAPARERDADGGARTDGGAASGGVTVPREADFPDAPAEPAGAISTIDDSLSFADVSQLHGKGIEGRSVIAVNLDTGACGDQFADARQLAGADLTSGSDPYTDFADHGSYTMGVMAGGPQTEGIDRGWVPEADIFPIKSNLSGSEIIQAQDIIMDLADETGRPVIVNNSIGFQECTGICDHPVTDAVRTAASHPNVIQVWAAGNQAQDCGQDCSDTGINGPNSLDEVLTVGATGENGDPQSLHGYSNRGGETASCGQNKPDVTAPIFGTVPWGCGSTDIGNGGGTSGACPQVAGTVALMVDAIAEMRSVDAAAEAIEQTARQFQGSGWNGCTGHGNVDSAAAADAFGEVVPRSEVGSLGVVAAGALSGFAPIALDEARRR